MIIKRRNFIRTSLAASAGLLSARQLHAQQQFKTKLFKATIVGRPEEDSLRQLKEAGFNGVETTAVISESEAADCRRMADKLGMRIHSVLRGWTDMNSPDRAKVEASVASAAEALKAAKGYGADAILLVPCRTDGMPMPEAWDFAVEFDEKSSHVTRVVAGDNDKYKPYIEAQNRATDTSREAIRKLIPVAEETKVVIAVENVWNNLWVTPALAKNLVESFQSPWIKFYFDIGNHVKYPAKPQDWIRTLGPFLAKVHIKDFKLKPDGHGGDFVHPRDGSVEWPAVRQALDDAGYNGWLTIEDGGLSLAEFNKRLDMIIEGK
ncbi:MAG: sugar phosphate isomerase/epimerase [Verrucomicrobia bacterium]|nr:sugar phosphate isomerase/epimerase [Verrucomicrobiota bacterium]